MKFLSRHTVALTPLSPIHIGCGEDFEPTNYVIDAEQKLLYGFDPSLADLSEELTQKLAELGERGNWLGIQGFFREHQKHFKPWAHILIPVASGVARDYCQNIGRAANVEADGRQVINRLSIERHIHSRDTPYIPGSSLKGSLRTGLMDKLNHKRPVTDSDEKKNSMKLAKRLLEGDFATSPLRLLKIGDLIPCGDLDRGVLYAVNRYKHPKSNRNGQPISPRGIVARKECILPGQYRVLMGEITVQSLGGKGILEGEKRNVPKQNLRPDITQIAKDCNAYHLPRLRTELAEMGNTCLVNPSWKRFIESLLEEGGILANRLRDGQIMLVRMGRYGGAESKTLTEVADIKIMLGRGENGRREYEFRRETTTYWLAAQTADEQKHLIPFGWAILEIDPQDNLRKLKTWCEEETKNRPDMKAKCAALAEEKAKAQKRTAMEYAKRKAVEDAQRQAEKAAAQAATEKAQYLATLSEAGREIEKFKEECAQNEQRVRGRKGKPYGMDYSRARALAEKARSDESWSGADKQATAEAIEHWLPRLETLDAKEVRKKLKLPELTGI
ncbi:MAG: type III-A CRISPR-associated RAMP protein Csm5 [Candidatus Accumulibacter sp.]|jgi:CRISPR-associated protein Csm5|nr:type III-A CRISPR-associated RAMP protein Csm5 [Accumulibacter sp.]